MIASRCVTVHLLFTVAYASVPLPSYIKPCARDDPNLEKCALEHGKAAIPQLIKGDRRIGVPNLDPVEISEIEVPAGPFTFDVKNVTLYGLKDVDLKRVAFDLKQYHVSYEMFFPVLEIRGHYEINGKILLLPITGSGDMNITLENSYTKTHSELKKVEVDGVEFLRFQNLSTQIEPQQVHFHFTNLFNGNKLLGDEMNQLLNREWKDAWREFGPAMTAAANKIIQNLSDNYSSKVTFDDWFPKHL